jgi:peptidoglycan/LPS O-acetylase OafA/YrhL
MLQRSQTLFLLGAFILSILLLTGPLARFTLEGSEYVLKHTGLYDAEGERGALVTWPLTVYFVLVALLSFLVIFFYRNRVRQMRMTVFLILLNAGMVAMMFYYVAVARHELDGAITVHLWRFIVPPISMILLYLAFRRIRRDELLVKAYDRIR